MNYHGQLVLDTESFLLAHIANNEERLRQPESRPELLAATSGYLC